MLYVDPLTSTSSTSKTQDSSNPEDQDIWFDTIDYVEMEETWFDAHEEHQTSPSSSAGEAADSRVPFTEDCRRGVQLFVRTLGEYAESKILSVCLSKILPGTPTSLVIAANSLYTAITQRQNIDAAALHTLGLASWYLPDNINVVSQLANFIRDSVIGWTDDIFLQQFLGEEENHISINLFTALAVTAIVAGRWMKDEGGPQRGPLKIPAFMANILIRASHYWIALGNMSRCLPSGVEIRENNGTSQQAPAFEVDTQVEITEGGSDATIPCASAPRLTALSSNSTAIPEAYTRATVQNRPAPVPRKNNHLSVPEQVHYLVVDKLRQENGLSDLLHCTNLKTETRQQINEKVITNTHFNTKCDAIVYPEPLMRGADSIPVHTDTRETQVSSAATGRSGGDALLPLVMSATAAPVASSYMQALKSKFINTGAVALVLTTVGIGGKLLWNKRNPAKTKLPNTNDRSITNSSHSLHAEFLSQKKGKDLSVLLEENYAFENVLKNPVKKHNLLDQAILKSLDDSAYNRKNIPLLRSLEGQLNDIRIHLTNKTEMAHYVEIKKEICREASTANGTCFFNCTIAEYPIYYLDRFVPEDMSGHTLVYITALIDKVLKNIDHGNNSSNQVNKEMANAVIFQSMYDFVSGYSKLLYRKEPDKIAMKIVSELKYVLSNMYNFYDLNHHQYWDKYIKNEVNMVFFSSLIDANYAENSFNKILSPYINNNSSSLRYYRQFMNEERELKPEVRHVINNLVKSISNEINVTATNFLPFSFYGSEHLNYINNNTKALALLLPYTGLTTYYVPNEKKYDESITNETKKNIGNAAKAIASFRREGYLRNDLRRFVASLDEKKFKIPSVSNNSSMGEEFYLMVRSKFNETFNFEIDKFANSLPSDSEIGNDYFVPDNSKYFMRTLRSLMNQYKNKIDDNTPGNIKKLLTKTMNGKLKRKNLLATNNKATLCDFVYRNIFADSLFNNVTLEHFSVHSLSYILNFPFSDIAEISMQNLLESGCFYRVRERSLLRYDDNLVLTIEHFISRLSESSESALFKSLGVLFEKKDINHQVSLITEQVINEEVSDEEIIQVIEYELGRQFVSMEVNSNDTISILTNRVISEFKNVITKIKNTTYQEIIAKKKISDKEILILKKLNLANILLDIELEERFEILRLSEDIFKNSTVVDNILSTPFAKFSREDSVLESIRQSKIAAVRHLYNTNEQNEVILNNIYDATFLTGAEEADTLKSLSVLYWMYFGHHVLREHLPKIIPYLQDTKKTILSTDQKDSIYKNDIVHCIKLLISFSSLSRVTRLQNVYQSKYSGKAAELENTLSGRNLIDTYYSIANIKKRSEIESYDQKTYADQFSRYINNGGVDKDATVILGATLRKSGVDLKLLSTPPQKIWSFQHVNLRHEDKEHEWQELNIEGRNNDLIVMQLQDGSFVLSYASIFSSYVAHSTNIKQSNDIYDSGFFIKEYPANELDLLKFRYGISASDIFTIKNTEPEYIILNLKKLERLNVSVGHNTDHGKSILVFKKKQTNFESNKSIEDICRVQIKSFIDESINNMKILYDDHEDTLGHILNFVPFASAIRKGANGLPLTRAEIALTIIDGLTVGLNQGTHLAKSVFKNGIKDVVQNSVNQLIKREPVNFTPELAFKVSSNALKTLANKSVLASIVLLNELIMLTPVPLIWNAGRFIITSGSAAGVEHIFRRSGNSLKKMSTNPMYYKRALDRTESIMSSGIYLRIGEEGGDEIIKSTRKRLYQPQEGFIHNGFAQLQPEAAMLTAEHHMNHFIHRSAASSNIGWPLIEPALDNSLLLAARDVPGIEFFPFNQEGLNILRQRLNTQAYNQAVYATEAIHEAHAVISRVNDLLVQALNNQGAVLYQNMARDIHSLTGVLAPDLTLSILRQLQHRTDITRQISLYYSNNSDAVRFYLPPEAYRYESLAFTYPEDINRLLFINAAGEQGISIHKTIIHEASHHSKTEDFIYQISNDFTGQLTSTSEAIHQLRLPQTPEALMQANLDHHISSLLDLEDGIILTPNHYRAAFDIIHNNNFPQMMLINNADSYTYFVEYVDLKYTLHPDGHVTTSNFQRQLRDVSNNKKEIISKKSKNMLSLFAKLGGVYYNA